LDYRSMIINIALFCLYSLIILIVNEYSVAMILILLLVVFLHNNLQHRLYKLVFRKQFFLLSAMRQLLEKLNDDLNRAFRFQEISKLLYGTFHQIFPECPYAFYIFENGKYYLSQYEFIIQHDDLPYNFDQNIFAEQHHLTKKGRVPCEEMKFSETDTTEFKKFGFDTLLPFYGHNQIFAFLLTSSADLQFLDDEPVRKLLLKIQKKSGLKLESSGLIIDLEKKNYETRKIMEVSQRILTAVGDPKNILDFILDTLHKVVYFDAAAIFLLDSSGKRLLNASSRGYDKKILKNLHIKVGQGACGWVAKSKEIDVFNDIETAKHYIEFRKETRSQISIPLIFEDEVLGVLCLESDQRAFFTEARVEILKLFANQAAIALHNARQMDIKLAKQAFEHELINAGKVQRGLLLDTVPKLENLSVTAFNLPSKIVSGDLYDVTKFSDDSMGVAIGDIAGKGAPAALMMSLILAGLRSQNKVSKTTCDLVYRLNNLLSQTTIQGKYATFFYGIINMHDNTFIYTNAGHNPPILCKKDGTVTELTSGGIVLGFLYDQEYKQEEVNFEKDDVLVAYTDGITETMNKKEEEFGEERLRDIILQNRDKDVYTIKESILKAIKSFSNNANPDDDITMIICNHL